MNLESVIEWNKSEKEKQISYIINAYMWNLEKWYRWTYFQGRNRDIENRRANGREAGVGWLGRLELAYIHYHVQS